MVWSLPSLSLTVVDLVKTSPCHPFFFLLMQRSWGTLWLYSYSVMSVPLPISAPHHGKGGAMFVYSLPWSQVLHTVVWLEICHEKVTTNIIHWPDSCRFWTYSHRSLLDPTQAKKSPGITYIFSKDASGFSDGSADWSDLNHTTFQHHSYQPWISGLALLSSLPLGTCAYALQH